MRHSQKIVDADRARHSEMVARLSAEADRTVIADAKARLADGMVREVSALQSRGASESAQAKVALAYAKTIAWCGR